MKHGSLVFMGVELAIIVFDGLNLVPAASLVRAHMEVPGILIPFNCSTDLSALLPQGKFGLSDTGEHHGDDSAQIRLRGGERSVLLHTVQEVDHNLAVCFLLGDVGVSPPPKLQRTSGLLEVMRNVGSRVTAWNLIMPSRSHSLSEAWAASPVVVKPESIGQGDAGSDVSDERHMV